MSSPRNAHTATLLASGEVLVAGGINFITALSSSEQYNPSTGNWTKTGDLNVARDSQTATLLPSGQVLVAGGTNNTSGVLNTAELFNPATGKWTSTGSMNTARSGHTATLLQNGQVLVAGGDSSGTAELYNPPTGTWTAASSMNTARSGNTSTLLGEVCGKRVGAWQRGGSRSIDQWSCPRKKREPISTVRSTFAWPARGAIGCPQRKA